MTILDSLDDPKLASMLLAGGVGVIPTDTVYGIVCRAASPAAADKLYTLKPREYKPGTIVAATVEQLVELGLRRRYIAAVENLWPNPISIILPIPAGLSYLDQGRASLPFRIPKDRTLQQLLTLTGPLLTTSANDPDQPVSTNLGQAIDYFHDRVDFYVDGGDLAANKPSTIMRVLDDEIDVIREGAVSRAEIERILSL